MMCYLVQPRDQIFVKGYGFVSFPKHFGESKGAIQETAEATTKIANKIRKDSKNSQQRNLETNELQMSMVNTNLKKDVYIYIYIYVYIYIYLQNKDRTLFMICD